MWRRRPRWDSRSSWPARAVLAVARSMAWCRRRRRTRRRAPAAAAAPGGAASTAGGAGAAAATSTASIRARHHPTGRLQALGGRRGRPGGKSADRGACAWGEGSGRGPNHKFPTKRAIPSTQSRTVRLNRTSGTDLPGSFSGPGRSIPGGGGPRRRWWWSPVARCARPCPAAGSGAGRDRVDQGREVGVRPAGGPRPAFEQGVAARRATPGRARGGSTRRRANGRGCGATWS